MPSSEIYWRDPQKYREAALRSAARHRDRVNRGEKRWRLRTPLLQLLKRAKQRAKKIGVPCSIRVDDLFIPECCPVLGIRLVANDDMSHDASPTLDRIIPSLGYIRGNVRVISHRANRIKNDATPNELSDVARYAARETALLRWRGLDVARVGVPRPLKRRESSQLALSV